MSTKHVARKIACPNDGSTDVHWHIATQKLRCGTCRHEFNHVAPPVVDEVDTFNGIPIDSSITAELSVPENITEYKCVSCGAKVVLDTNTAMSSKCSWCRHELVPDKVLDTEFTPNGIVPFVITEEKALKTFRKWVKRHWFVRGDFAKKDSDIEIKPIYYPFYTVDHNGSYDVRATGVRNRSRRSGNWVITTHERFSIKAPSVAFVDDFELPALTEIKNQLIINSIEPFDWRQVRPFDYAYLNTYAAEHRDTEVAKVRGEVNRTLTSMIYADIEGDLQRSAKLENVRVQSTSGVSKESIAYCLAPVWLITYVDQKDKKVYYFALNGQTSKASGILPVSYQKLVVFLMIFTLVASVVTALVNILYLTAVSAGGV